MKFFLAVIFVFTTFINLHLSAKVPSPTPLPCFHPARSCPVKDNFDTFDYNRWRKYSYTLNHQYYNSWTSTRNVKFQKRNRRVKLEIKKEPKIVNGLTYTFSSADMESRKTFKFGCFHMKLRPSGVTG